MRRRTFLGSGLVALNAAPLVAAFRASRWDAAAEVLRQVTASGQVEAAVLHVDRAGTAETRPFGKARSEDAMFLLGSISKPINIAAFMTLFDKGKFGLDDRASAHLPAFRGEGREDVTIRHLLTHTSGLPDQLINNNALRKSHAGLREFAEHAANAPLSFAPGSQYQYSSMGILLACRIGEIVGGSDMLTLVDQSIFRPLGMRHSSQGLGRFRREEMVPCQMEGAAPESGGGDPTSRDWDWNSAYWRSLGAPWGGTHASAPDIGRFLAEFLRGGGQALRPETARLMTRNHNPAGLTPRGLGFGVGKGAGSPGCSDRTFGHTGSTGTLCWADPATDTICVVLTSLPGRTLKVHPRALAAEKVAEAARR